MRAVRHAITYANGNGDSHSYTNSYSDSYGYSNSNGYADSDGDGNTEACSNTEASPDTAASSVVSLVTSYEIAGRFNDLPV